MKRYDITVLSIDGQGKQTLQYLQLLIDTLTIFPVKKAMLLSSDPDADHPNIECIKIPTLGYLEYSQFCVEQLANFVHTEHMLNLQLDGFIVNPHRWNNAFLEYDYIGAPWQSKKHRPIPNGVAVGNGGFSLAVNGFYRLAPILNGIQFGKGAGCQENTGEMKITLFPYCVDHSLKR